LSLTSLPFDVFCAGIRISNVPLFGTFTALNLLRRGKDWQNGIDKVEPPKFMRHFTFIWRNDSVASAIKKLLNKGGTYSLENDYRANFGVSLIKWGIFLGN
jgi:hypothetical protein